MVTAISVKSGFTKASRIRSRTKTYSLPSTNIILNELLRKLVELLCILLPTSCTNDITYLRTLGKSIQEFYDLCIRKFYTSEKSFLNVNMHITLLDVAAISTLVNIYGFSITLE